MANFIFTTPNIKTIIQSYCTRKEDEEEEEDADDEDGKLRFLDLQHILT